MAIRLWKSKEQRMREVAEELLQGVETWISLRGGEDFSVEEQTWVEEQKSHARVLQETAVGARYGWGDLLQYVVAPVAIVGLPLMLVYFLLGRFFERTVLPQSAGAWWSFPLFCLVMVPLMAFGTWIMDVFERVIVQPQRAKELAAIREARREVGAMCDAAIKRINAL